MKKYALILLPLFLFALSCAHNREAMKYRRLAEDASLRNDFYAVNSNILNAANACEDTVCIDDNFMWMLHFAEKNGNEVLMANAYTLWAGVYSDLRKSPTGAISERYAQKSREIIREYLVWADSIHNIRGGPFPLVNALLLNAVTVAQDSPRVAILHLIRIINISSIYGDSASAQLLKVKEEAERNLDDIGRTMAYKFDKGMKGISGDSASVAEKELIWAYDAAVGFGNIEVASQSARALVEYYKRIADKKSAGEWTGRLLKIEGEKELKKIQGEDRGE